MSAGRLTGSRGLIVAASIGCLVALAFVVGYSKSSHDKEAFTCGYDAGERERPTADDYRFAPPEATHDRDFLIPPNCLYYHELVFGLTRDKARKIRDAWGR